MEATVRNNNTTIDKEGAVKIINSRKQIIDTGYYQLKVTSVVPYDGKFIIGLSAMSSYHLEEAVKALKAGDYQTAVNKSFSATVRPVDYLPAKGEIVKAYIDEVTTKSGVKGLFVTSLVELKSNKTYSINLSLEEETIDANKELIEAGASKL